MCTSCHEPLAVAQSPQADSERAYIRGLIAKGETKQQIVRQPRRPVRPRRAWQAAGHGFNLTVYILPPAILILGAAILFVTLPRWRRRTRAPRHSRRPVPPRSIHTRRVASTRISPASAAELRPLRRLTQLIAPDPTSRG